MKIEKSGYIITYNLVTRVNNTDPCVEEVLAHSNIDTAVLIESVIQKKDAEQASFSAAVMEFLAPFRDQVVLYHTPIPQEDSQIPIRNQILMRYNDLMRFEVLNFINIDFAVGLDNCTLLAYKNEAGTDLVNELMFKLGCDLMFEARHNDDFLKYLADTLSGDSALLERLEGYWEENERKNDGTEELDAF